MTMFNPPHPNGRLDCGDYKGLFPMEFHIVGVYFIKYDVKPLIDLLRSDREISGGMRSFIADALSGKFKRPPGKKPSKLSRDMRIHDRLVDLAEEAKAKGKKGLYTAHVTKVMHEFNLSEHDVKNAYKRVEKIRKDRLKLQEELIASGMWRLETDSDGETLLISCIEPPWLKKPTEE